MALSRKWYSHPLVLSNYTRCLFRHTLIHGTPGLYSRVAYTSYNFHSQ